MRLSPASLSFVALVLLATCASPLAAQNFLQPKVIPTGNWPAAVYSADVNNDGYPDLIYIDQAATPQTSTTHVLLNDGKGNFTQSAVIATAGNSLAIGPMTGDGHIDIAWVYSPAASQPSTSIAVTVAAGRGDGTFASPQVVPRTTLNAYSSTVLLHPVAGYVTAGQVQASAAPDLLFEDTVNQIMWDISLSSPPRFAGGGDGFSLASGGPLSITGGGIGPITVADLNGDGYGDIIINNLQQTTANVILYSPTQGTYDLHSIATSNVRSFLIKDINLDGRPDLIAEGTNGHIDVFPGNGDGTFQTTSIGGTGPLNGLTGNGGHLIATGDFNHDGLIDALTATPVGISTLLGQGTQYLGLEGIYNVGPGGFGGPAAASAPTDYALADFNHDGNLDLALDSPEGIAILYGNADGSFQSPQAYAAGQPAMSGALGKFASTSVLSSIVSTGSTQAQLLINNSAGAFTAAGVASPAPTTSQNGTPGLWSTVTVADFNGDGNPDIVITADGPYASFPANSLGTIVQLSDKTGHFATPFVVTSSGDFCSQFPGAVYGVAVAADLNGDSRSDLVVRDRAQLTVYTGTASGIPSYVYSAQPASCDPNPHAVATVGDFHNTGSPDLITQYPSNGTNDLVLIPSVPSSNFSYKVPADFSVDGQLDTPGQLIAPVLSNSFGGTSPTLGFPAAVGSMVVADLDRDGNTDLLVSYANLSANLAAPTSSAPNYLYIWFGSGNGKFLTSNAHPTNPVRITLSRNYYQVAVADMNGDNIPDLILSDGYILSVQLGKGDGTFGAETHYLAGQGINTISVGDLRGTGHNDLVLANGGAVLTNPVANLEKLATNPDVNTGGVTVLLNQTKTAALITLPGVVSASPEPSAPGARFDSQLTWTVPNGQPLPTGTVTYTLGGVLLGSDINSFGFYSGISNFGYSGNHTFTPGTYTLTASYSGDTVYAAAVYSGTHTIANVVTPTGSLTASPEPSVYGTPFIITATVNTTAGLPAPTGTVTFSVDGTVISATPVTLANGTASIPDPSLTVPAGTHTLTAVYSGDSNYGPVTLTGSHVINAVATPFSVVASPEPSVYGSAFTITATAGPGTYVFSVDGVSLGTVVSASNTASIIGPGTLNVGSHSLSVVWHAPMSALAAQLTGTHQVVINPTTLNLLLCVDAPGSQFPCATPIASTPLINPITFYYGQSLDGVATESATNLTGSIIFYDGTRVFCTLNANLTGGANTCPTTSGNFDAGSRVVYATYTGDSNNAPSTSNSINVVVSPDTTTATLTSSLNPALAGTAVTFTAILSGNFATPNGNVSFYDGTTLIGGGVLDPTGHANFTTSTLAIGSHPVTVVYTGNANFNAVTSAVLTQVIASGPITGRVAATPEPSAAGATFTLTASVTPPAGSASTVPTGTIAFSIDGNPVGTATLSGGVATLAGPTTLAVGSHILTAAYSGDTNYLPAGPFSGTHSVILSPTTTQLIAIGSTTIYFNQPANSSYSTTVAGATHPATGTVTVQDNGVSISYCTGLAYGSTCPYAAGGTNRLTVGTHSLVVLYNGDSFNAASTSPPLVFTVLPDTTTATVSSSLNPAYVGNAITFNAALTGNNATPTGSVNFLDGGTVLSTQALSAGGTASFTTSALLIGTHPITVTYAGNTNFGATVSTVLNEVVTPPPPTFTFTLSPNPITVGAGATAPLLATVTTSSTFTANIALTCSNLPYEVTCNFVTPILPATGGATTLQLHVTAPHDCGSSTPYFIGSTAGSTGPAPYAFAAIFFGAFAICKRRRRTHAVNDWTTLVLLFLALVGLAGLSGCAGHCTDLGTRPGTYSFTVTATPQGVTTPTAQSITIPLTVTIP